MPTAADYTAWEDEWHTAIKGTHKLTSSNYSFFKSLKENVCVASDKFEVAGHEWVVLFFPQGLSCDYVSHVPGELPAASKMPQASPDDQDAEDTPDDTSSEGGASPAASAAEGKPQQAAAARRAPIKDMKEQHLRMVLRQQRRYGDAALQAAARAKTVELGLCNARRDKVDYAAVYIAHVGETKHPQGIVLDEEDSVGHRAVRIFCGFTLLNHKEPTKSLSKRSKTDMGPVYLQCPEQPSMIDRHCKFSRFGYRKFIKKSKLFDPANGWLKDDTLEIHIGLNVLLTAGKPSTTCVNPLLADTMTVPGPSMAAEMAETLETGCGSDLQLLVRHPQHVQQSFPVHRLMLQLRCPRLGQLALDAGGDSIVVEDLEPHVAKAMLYALYTDELPLDMQGDHLEQDMAGQLLQAGMAYGLWRLVALCEGRLARCISADTAVGILLLADSCKAQELKRVCLQFMAANLAELLVHASFLQLQQQQPMLQIELFDMLGSFGHVGSEAAQQLQEAAAAEIAKVASAAAAKVVAAVFVKAEATCAELQDIVNDWLVAAAEDSGEPGATSALPGEVTAAAASLAGLADAAEAELPDADLVEASCFGIVESVFAAYADCGFEHQHEFESRVERASKGAASAATGQVAAESADDVSGDINGGLFNAEEGAAQGEEVGSVQQLTGAGSPCKRARVDATAAVGRGSAAGDKVGDKSLGKEACFQ